MAIQAEKCRVTTIISAHPLSEMAAPSNADSNVVASAMQRSKACRAMKADHEQLVTELKGLALRAR
jgi:hypothetical protein